MYLGQSCVNWNQTGSSGGCHCGSCTGRQPGKKEITMRLLNDSGQSCEGNIGGCGKPSQGGQGVTMSQCRDRSSPRNRKEVQTRCKPVCALTSESQRNSAHLLVLAVFLDPLASCAGDPLRRNIHLPQFCRCQWAYECANHYGNVDSLNINLSY